MAESLEAESSEQDENPYLALRRAKIARNEARLRELGLLKPSPSVVTPPKISQSRKRSASKSVEVPVRRSRRLCNSIKEPLSPENRDSRHVEPEEQENRSPKPKSKAVPKPKINASSVNLSPLSARNIALDINKLLSDFLGQPMNATGKAAVMEASARQFSPLGESINGKISFNKYCGVQEWRRGIYLWVNLGCIGNSVVNDFLDGGRKMTWYGGSRMHSESPIIEKLVQVGKLAAAHRNGIENTNDAIILWCRQYQADKKTFGPYYCLGRLAYFSHQPETMPVSFVWTLLDFDPLVDLKREAISSMMGIGKNIDGSIA